MKVSRAILFWVVVISALLVLELVQVTGLFRLPFSSILGNVLSFIFALLLVTILALIGAVFVGIFIAHRILSPQGFTPFEEEMLHMRQEVQEIHRRLDQLHPPSGSSSDGPRPGPSETPAAGSAERSGEAR